MCEYETGIERKYHLQIIKITISQNKIHKFRLFENVKGIFIPLLLLMISITILGEQRAAYWLKSALENM